MTDLDRLRREYAARMRELGDEGGARLLERPMPQNEGRRPLAWQGVAAAAVILALAVGIAALAALAPSREIVVRFEGPLVVRLER